MTNHCCIVLKSLKYSDSSLIVKCLTEDIGVVSYLLRGVLKPKKQGLKVAYFQPLTQLQIVARHSNKNTLQTITEARLNCYYTSLHTDFKKQAMVFFLSEVLSQCLYEGHHDSPLYDFISQSLKWLDKNTQTTNFHLVFLVKLTKHLGFSPNLENKKAPYFNLKEGVFCRQKPLDYGIDGELITSFKSLLTTTFEKGNDLNLNVEKRRSLLDVLWTYYKLHNSHLKTLKSTSTLQDMFEQLSTMH